MQGTDPALKMFKEPICLIRLEIWLGAVTMTQQIECVRSISILRELRNESIPIMQGGRDPVNEDHRYAIPLLYKIGAGGNCYIIHPRVSHTVLLIRVLRLFR